MVELRAALAGAAVSALVLTAVLPAASAAAQTWKSSSSGSGGSGPGAVLVTTDVAAPAAPAAVGGGGWDAITVDPAISRGGGTVDLRTFADCGGTETGSVGSAAFAAPVPLALAADGGLYAEARVAVGAAPGAYPVQELCQGKAVAVGTLTLTAPEAPDTGGGWGATQALAAADGDSLGGAAGRASLALVAAAALGGLVQLRRRFHG